MNRISKGGSERNHYRLLSCAPDGARSKKEINTQKVRVDGVKQLVPFYTLDLLDSYDHQNMTRPKGNKATYVLGYEECMEVIQSMRFGNESDLFGREKDDSFKGSIGSIYQSFGGVLFVDGKRR